LQEILHYHIGICREIGDSHANSHWGMPNSTFQDCWISVGISFQHVTSHLCKSFLRTSTYSQHVCEYNSANNTVPMQAQKWLYQHDGAKSNAWESNSRNMKLRTYCANLGYVNLEITIFLSGFTFQTHTVVEI